MIPKKYQTDTLDCFEKFLKRCKELNKPAQAYEDITRESFNTALHYRPLPAFPQAPYVCLRIPTGGGKTLVGGLAIERVNRSLLFVEHSVTLWLVPSDPIREQTLRALRSPSNFLHQSVFSSLGAVTVLDIDEALRVPPATLNGTNTIIVSTMQAFKQEDTNRLSVYKQNGELMTHFEGISDPSIKGKGGLADVLRLRHPFVVVDEAHNQGTPLAFETLGRFEPCAILELTATPDRLRQPSNVLYSVSAASLQAADMIKMPLELVRRDSWQDALRDAIACLNNLQVKADEERKVTGDYLRPIMLIQAERHDAEHETLTPDKVKASMIADFNIPAEEIAIATGAQDDIAGVDVLSETCRMRFIITIDKLREGWDCPFAYSLCSFRNTESATAAEQVLGRILRLPYARKKQQTELNEAYAFVTSSNFHATVQGLRDGLIRNGFERQEAKDFIQSKEIPEGDLFDRESTETVAISLVPEPECIPKSLASKIDIAPEFGTITLKGSFTTAQKTALETIFQEEVDKEAIRRAVEIVNTKEVHLRAKTPAEMGDLFRVPLLSYRNGDLWEPFEETHLLQGEWRLLDSSCELSDAEFKKPDAGVLGGRIYVTAEGKINVEYFDHVERQLALLEFNYGVTQVELVSWLDKNIPESSVVPDEKAAFINKAVSWLQEKRGFTLDELNFMKVRLRAALEGKISAAKREAKKKVYESLFQLQDDFKVDERCEMRFEQGRYDYNRKLEGVELPKHFFSVVGDLEAKGEEFECAAFLATQLEGVKWWVRNTERKDTSFSLQTSTDRFYPDFICMLNDGRILVIEYKGADRWDSSDSIEKRQIGELWARRSNGKGIFVMPRGKDWAAIQGSIKK